MKNEKQVKEWLKCAEEHNKVLTGTENLMFSQGIIDTLKWVLEQKTTPEQETG